MIWRASAAAAAGLFPSRLKKRICVEERHFGREAFSILNKYSQQMGTDPCRRGIEALGEDRDPNG
jgi:hypothetical protein